MRVIVAGALMASLTGVRVHAAEPKQARLEITLTVDPGRTVGREQSWVLSVRQSGRVTTQGDEPGGMPEWTLQISARDRAGLAEMLTKERFFKLRWSNYGCAVDLASRSITVVLNGRKKRVDFCPDLPMTVSCDGGPDPDMAFRDVQRLLRVWYGTVAAASKAGVVQPSEADARFLAAKPRRRTRR